MNELPNGAEAPPSPPRRSGTPRKYNAPPVVKETPPSASSVYSSDDPLKGLLLDPEVKVLGEADDTIPEEVREFINQHDFGKRYFQVILKEVLNDGVGDTQTGLSFIRSWYRTIPTLEHIAKNYGPGKYVYVINYRGTDPETGKQTSQSEKIYFEISDRYEQEYLDYQRDRKIENLKKSQNKVRDFKLDKQFDAALDGKPESGDERSKLKEYVSEITGMARDLGLTRQQDGLMSSIGPFLPAIAAAVSGVFKMISDGQTAATQQMNQMLMLMLGQHNKSSEQLIELMKVQGGQGAGSTAIREFTDMIKDAVDLKEILKGDKVSVADRVFGVIEGILPQILTLAATSKAQQAMDPRVNMARAFVQNDPTFQQAIHDPAILAEVIRKLDGFYGWAQTDGILQIAGLNRPETCPRKPDEEKPQGERPAPDDGGAVDGETTP